MRRLYRNAAERGHVSGGDALKQRQVVFFVIFLSLALVSFAVLRRILGPG
jgi:hypothetical protein